MPLLLALVLLGVVALTAVLVAAASRAELDSAKSELAAREQQIERLLDARSRLADSLSGSKRLSEKRAAVLRRAGGVLAIIDPLLSSVDDLKTRTARIQAARDDFLYASGAATEALVNLGNYLIDAGGSADPDRVSDLIDAANARIDEARAAASKLASFDARYAGAAKRFDLRASRLSRDVEALRQELRAVTGA